MEEKKILRTKLRQQRLQLTKAQVHSYSKKIFQEVIEQNFFLQAKNVALYLPDSNEVDTHAILFWFLKRDVSVYLPVVEEQTMSFYLYHPQKLKQNRFGIAEPDPMVCAKIDIFDLDLIVVPVLGFDVNCQRIGRGAGFYDRALADVVDTQPRPTLCGLAYEVQQVPNCFAQPHDVPLDAVITEQCCYHANPQTDFQSR
jgi:5-formyltetrahydrofolate cyclo-ligase